VAVIELPMDPSAILAAVLEGDRRQVGERVVGLLLSVWDNHPDRSPLIALVRSAVTSEEAARMLREFLASVLFDRIARGLGMSDAPLRASLVAAQVMGLAVARYIVGLEPIASAPREVVIAAVGPTVQRYLTGDIGPA
jgi:hypothetical protein